MGRFLGFFGSLFGFSTGGASSAAGAGVSPAEALEAGAGARAGSASAVGGSEGGVSGAVGGGSPSIRLPHRLLFPASHELVEAHAIHLNDFVPNSGDVSVRAAHPPANPFDEDLVVFVDEVDRAVPNRERRHLTTVLDQLDFHAFPQRGVRLLRLDRDLFQDDAFRLRRSLQRVGALFEVLHPTFVVPIGPAVGLSLILELSRREETPCHASRSTEGRANRHVIFNHGVTGRTRVRTTPSRNEKIQRRRSRRSRARRYHDRPLAVRAGGPFLREVPPIDVAAAVRTRPDEVRLSVHPLLPF